jgi:hypothetical protein
MRSRYQSRHIQQFNRHAPLAIDAGPIVWFTAVGELDARTGAFDLEVADGALGVYGCESGVVESGTTSQSPVECMRLGRIRRHVDNREEKGLSYGKFPINCQHFMALANVECNA